MSCTDTDGNLPDKWTGEPKHLGKPGGQHLQYNGRYKARQRTQSIHSLGQFNVPTNTTANFLNDSGLATSNILGRVTGGNPSNIFGTIQTTGFGNANLFVMNPAGIVFGPTASLNVGGSVSFTTADYLRLTDGARFNAIAGPQDLSISSAPVAAFGFLGSNLRPLLCKEANSPCPKVVAFIHRG